MWFIKIKQVADNIGLVVDVIDLNKNKDQFVIISLNAGKAFDRIHTCLL